MSERCPAWSEDESIHQRPTPLHAGTARAEREATASTGETSGIETDCRSPNAASAERRRSGARPTTFPECRAPRTPEAAPTEQKAETTVAASFLHHTVCELLIIYIFLYVTIVKRETAATPPPPQTPTEPTLTEEELEKKSTAIIEEYLHINDMKVGFILIRRKFICSALYTLSFLVPSPV